MSGWRGLFWLASGFNLVVGVGGIFDAAWASPEAMGAVLIACFGIVYALVARDPPRFAPMLWPGMIGKLLVVAMLAPVYWRSGGDPAIGTIVALDLAFALGFALYLCRRRAAPMRQPDGSSEPNGGWTDCGLAPRPQAARARGNVVS